MKNVYLRNKVAPHIRLTKGILFSYQILHVTTSISIGIPILKRSLLQKLI